MENNKEILSKISSGEPELLAEAVKEIKENGDLSIAEELVNLLEQISDQHLLTVIINLLADIKDNEFREIVMRHIQNNASPATKTVLLRIIWESPLDYSVYLPIFMNILQHDDFTTAFEASTVIENMVHNLTEDQHHQLHHFIASFPSDKQFLIENIHTEMGCCEED